MVNDGKLRLLRILQLLQRESDENHPISTAQIELILRERFGLDAYRITIQKDIAALISAGYPIETIHSTQCKYYLAQRTFETPELKLLIDAVESSKFITKKKSRALVAKLLTLTNEQTAQGLKRNISIADRIKPKNENIYYYIDTVNEAINAKRKISFLYYEFTAAKKKRMKNGGAAYVFSPYTLTWNGDCYYMVGWSDKHRKIATFRVDRIYKTPEILSDSAVPKPKEYSIADFSEKAFQLFDGERTTVELLCHQDVMNSVLDHFSEKAKTKQTDESHFILTAEVSLSPTFFAWVFQFGEKIRIIGPSTAVNQYSLLKQI